jgi:flagellar capping protein FliD
VSSDYDGISKIGMRTTRNGRYELDDTSFSRAYNADPEHISRLFTTAGTGLADRVDDFVDKYNRTSTGIIPSRRSSLQRYGLRLDKDILTAQDRLDKFEISMRKQFDSMETAVSNWQAQGMAVANMFR